MSFYLTILFEALGRNNSQHEVNIITLQQLLNPVSISLYMSHYFEQWSKYLTTRFSMFSWHLSTAITSHRLEYFRWCYFIWQVYLKVWGQKVPTWFKSKHNCGNSYFLFPYPYFIKSHYFGRFWHHSSNKGGKEDCHILICSLFIWVLIILLNYFYHLKIFMLGTVIKHRP